MAKILIVEDDATLRDTLQKRLAEEGYTVVNATDALSGLATLKKENSDLILLDLRLDGQSGLDLLREIQADPAFKNHHPKVIVLTNIEHPAMTIETLGYGLAAEDYLIKSKVSLENIVARVKTKLESSP